ncbi:CHAT domain-containing protein [Streptomyces sp. NPDC001985]|uniref:CHAT domain-containing protein n=1 Tax=Streptomyces sp. NPDC001985 TaxID=3154406 RepID=UPI0033347BCB
MAGIDWRSAVAGRLRRAEESGEAAALFGPAADAELRGLLRGCDLRTDLSARWLAGWLYWARCGALGEGRGRVEGVCAGTLLHPVWAADPGAVPAELAAGFAAVPVGTRPRPDGADGPAEWDAVCRASLAAAEGARRAGPGDDGRLAAFAAGLRGSGRSRDELLASAVGAGTLAVLATPEDDRAAHASLLSHLAAAQFAAARAWNDADLLDDALRMIRRTVRLLPEDDPDRLPALSNYALSLAERYERGHHPEDLDEAIGAARDVVDQTGRRDPELGRYQGNLGLMLQLRLARDGGGAREHDEIVALLRRAAPGHPEGRGAGLAALAGALVLRYRFVAAPADLTEAIALLREADGTPWSDPRGRARARETLATALRLRGRGGGDPADPDGSRERALAGEVPEDGGADGPEPVGRRLQWLVNTGLELRARYERGAGGPGDAATAVARLREALTLTPPGHPQRAAVLNDLGSVLLTGHRAGAPGAGPAEAVEVLRACVALTPGEHSMLGGRLLNLSGALLARFRLADDSADLREAVECRERAAALPGLPPAQRAAIVSATGAAMLHGTERAPDPDAVAGAVERLREAVRLTPDTEPLLPQRRLNLALALLTLAGVSGRRRYLREAAALADGVVADAPHGAAYRAGALVAAAQARYAGVRAPGSGAARDEVVALLRAAVDATPDGHPNLTARLWHLGTVLAEPRGRGPSRADLTAAAEAFRAGALEPHGAPSDRLDAAREWGRAWAALDRPERALEGFTTAVDLLPAVSPRHLVRDDQEFRLSRTVGLGAEAAACALRCGDPGLAVRLLEQARGVLLSHAFDVAGDLTELASRAPELAGRFLRLRERLDAATAGGGPWAGEGGEGAPAGHGGGTAADARQEAAAEWRELIGRIRDRFPGLRLFSPVRAWEEGELRAMAADGPVVLVHSPGGPESPGGGPGGALVITAGSVGAVPLPGLTAREVAARTGRFQDALALLAAPECGRKGALRAQEEVRRTLEWLWEAVAGPVLGWLGLTAPPAPGVLPPRLWWSPGGPLGSLPLHAAAPAGGGPGALDLVVSSYTPTLRALHHARARLRGSSGPPGRVLVVAVPDAEGLPGLPGAREEARWLGERLPGAVVLNGGAANRAAVERLLREHPYAHFACHAVSDPLRPSDSRLVLHGPAGSPTVRELARLRLPGARLAYLSACDTLRTSPGLADESVHIVSAFQMAGFPHVIGSLWQVDDIVGARIARGVYERLAAADGSLEVAGTAAALHRTVREVREEYPRTPSLWACQVHAGP